MAPKEWLANADTVVSMFFPFEKAVRESNTLKVDRTYDPSLELAASAQWLHARIEGQIYLMKVMSYAAGPRGIGHGVSGNQQIEASNAFETHLYL